MNYFISDLHFGHYNILKYERTCFKDINEHDNYIINILSQLHATDTLYILGDLGVSTLLPELFNRISCEIVIILGNHDKQPKSFYETLPNVKAVYDKPLWYSKRILLSHEPLPVPQGCFNIHGHLHDSVLTLDNYINVSIHVADYKLLSSKKIDKVLSRTQKPNWDFMYEWFAPYFKTLSPHTDLVYNEDNSINIEASRKRLKEKDNE